MKKERKRRLDLGDWGIGKREKEQEGRKREREKKALQKREVLFCEALF